LNRAIKIGSRESELALWQARFIEQLIQKQGVDTELVLIKSEGDLNLVSPLYEMGVQGIFTKTLDSALLSGRIDIAVHSLKDVPTQLPQNLAIAAIPQRGSWKDILVYKDAGFTASADMASTIASSSLRRKSQWLNRYPAHTIESLRGNINTRLEKLKNTPNWDGVIFAAAGIERINLQVPHMTELDWMLPAPAQGALVVVCRDDDAEIKAICQSLNDMATAQCVDIERTFLRELMGGCSMPIGAIAEKRGDTIHFTGNILSLDGRQKVEIEMEFPTDDTKHAGTIAAKQLLSNGGDHIAQQLKTLMRP
jgi:hydroxymethylbilane synthase